jgi:hypothetical protein
MDYREIKKIADEARDLAFKLLQQEKLSKEEESQMITAAQAAVFIWSKAGTSLQIARAHWLTSRIFCRFAEGRLALLHAQLCDFHTKMAKDKRDFDEAFAIESLARAAALKGDLETASRLKSEAKVLGEKIRDPEEKKIFEQVFHDFTWFDLKDSE